jgi:hypothetical protein
VSDKPDGPFAVQPEPIQKAHGIDPNPFIDKDGQAYLYWAMGKIYAAKLKENMLELSSEPQPVQGLPEKGLKEGPFLFERNGVYYMTYPHVQNTVERLEYAMGDNPMGPFQANGVKVVPTFRGVGVTRASQQIEIDRYSLISDSGASVAFLDTLKPFNGWKARLYAKDAWIQYNSVDFGIKPLKAIRVRVSSKTGGVLQIRLDDPKGPVIAQVVIHEGDAWKTIQAPVDRLKTGIRNLVVSLIDDHPVEVDWISFQ